MIGRKPNDILQFKWKRLMVLKFEPKLNSKFMLKRSKTIKIMKGSKNRGGLTQVKVICILHTKKQEISIYYDSKESHAIEYCFWLWCSFWASHWHIKCKINWERTFKRLPNWAIYRKDCFFLGSIKEFRRNSQKYSIKKAIFKNSTIFTGKHLCWSLFSPVLESLQLY